MFKQFLQHSLYPYDKPKVNWLKAIFPIIIIVHHISNLGYTGLEYMQSIDAIIMPMFFAMSGFGLVICYKNNNNYINGFLKKSLKKLFIPYLIALVSFIIYREMGGVNQIELLKEKGIISFVPTSWFIWTLSYFYIFFFIVFRYCKVSLSVKVALVCGLVLIYTFVASHIGIPIWRYRSNPGFCVGMLFALFDEHLKKNIVLWQTVLALCLLSVIIRLPIPALLLPCIYSTALFLLMYILGSVKENILVKFLSSISLEMFIIQFIPIYIMMNNLQVKSTINMVLLVLGLDIIIAYIIHLAVQRISARIK